MGCHAVASMNDLKRIVTKPVGAIMKLHGLLGGVALPVFAFAVMMPAFAQSTGTEAEETIVVTGQTKPKGGLLGKERITKTRSSVNQDYLQTQNPGQTIAQMINLLPGVSFTNNDPYGSSGGNIRLRGFDGNRISLTFDGTPLNDTGNYAIYTNQQVDGEIIQRATVNVGTTDVDSPTASATGGTINIGTRRPNDEFGISGTGSVGSFDFRRIFLAVDSGTFTPWGTSAYLTMSNQQYDKFKGEGTLRKQQYNAKVYQPIGDNGDFISIAAHLNINRNNTYNGQNRANLANNWKADFDTPCVRPTAQAGTVQNENLAPFSGCSTYWGVRINPSNTGNVRIQSAFTLADNLRLTIDPSYQYVLANGGAGNAVFAENDWRLRGSGGAAGVDLNGDGDVLDQIRLNSTSNTNTHRWGVTTSLLWDINENQTLRLAYTLDWGLHRQTGQVGFLKADGTQINPFAGMFGGTVNAADGTALRSRDRRSIAKLNQIALSYSGRFMEDRLRLNLGLRAPFFERELNQFCYTQANSANVRCTTEPVATTLPNGNVTFTGSSTQYIAPFSGVVRKYEDVLPNVGVSYEFAENHTVYASYAKGLSAPRTDNLYTARNVAGTVTLVDSEAETTNSFDLGYRYQGTDLILSSALWMTKYENRIVNAFDEELGFSVFRNLGSVDMWGFDVEAAWTPAEGLTFYGSVSYNHSEVKSNSPASGGGVILTAGKELVETPDWTIGLRMQYEVAGFVFGLQGKYVGDRWADDVNTEIAPAYTVVDADIRYDLGHIGVDNAYVQLNVINLFDEKYFGSFGSVTSAAFNPAGLSTNIFYNVGAPRTVQFSVGVQF